ncbi:MAG: hypothetical protein HY866_10010 [Chloroflexi bacterium]|nr:hypothetical protein [Chloroflexota bacterium]
MARKTAPESDTAQEEEAPLDNWGGAAVLCRAVEAGVRAPVEDQADAQIEREAAARQGVYKLRDLSHLAKQAVAEMPSWLAFPVVVVLVEYQSWWVFLHRPSNTAQV